MKFITLIAFVIFFLTFNIALQAQESDTICFAKYHVKDTYNKVEVGDYVSSSLDFNPIYTSNQALLRIFYTPKDGSSLQGQYSVSINIKNFKGIGTYILPANMGRWRTGVGTVSGIYDTQSGKITVDNYDSANKVISGTFSFSTSILVNGSVTQTFDISNGKFRTGRTFILKDYYKNPLVERTLTLFKPSITGDENLGDFTTDKDGKIYFSQNNGLDIGDPFYFHIYVDTVKAVKSSHLEVDDIMYQVTLDDIKINSKGQVTYDTLKNTSKIDTLKIIHTTILPNLLVSIDWDANSEYFTVFERWMRELSNYYYNLSNGQFYINKVSINDTAKYFDDADIQVQANNMVWSAANPDGIRYQGNAHIFSARYWYGNQSAGRNTSYKDDWLSNTSNGKYISPRTFAHEIGHYFFFFYDEYMDNANQNIFPNYNFGYMDTQYENADEYKDEMSNLARYSNPMYEITKQYVQKGADCWTIFKSRFGKVRKGLPCPILMPSEMDLPAGKDYLPGPNLDFNNLDRDVGASMTIITSNYDNGAGDYLLDLNSFVSNYSIYPQAVLRKPVGNPIRIKQILEGNTSDDGKIRILGANVGDVIFYDGRSTSNMNSYLTGMQTIDKVITSVKGKEQTPFALGNNGKILQDVSQKYAAVPVWKFSSDGFNLNVFSNQQYSQLPEIEVNLPGDYLKSYIMSYNSNSKIYSIDISDSLKPNGIDWLYLYDDSKNKFFSSFTHQIFNEYLNQISSTGNSAYIAMDSINNNINKIAVFSSSYIALNNGLDTNAIQASDIHCITSDPEFDPKSQNFFTINYEKSGITPNREMSLRIFKWNDTEYKWNIVGGSVDTLRNQVSCKINSTGTYCVFTSNNFLDVNDNNNGNNGENNFNIYPNPANGRTEISMNLKEYGFIKISVCDLLGNKIDELADGFFNAGILTRSLSTADYNSGTYLVKVTTIKGIFSRKLIIIK